MAFLTVLHENVDNLYDRFWSECLCGFEQRSDEASREM